MLDAGAIDEPSLLESLATVHGTQFVSTTRLSRARIDKRALRQVPLNVARHLGVYPLVFDETKSVLVIATANPGDEGLVKELKLVAVAKQIRLMVARPRAIRCAIARAYEGNSALFRDLLAEQPAALSGIDAPELNRAAIVPPPAAASSDPAAVPPSVVPSLVPPSRQAPSSSSSPSSSPSASIPPRPVPPPRSSRSEALSDKVGPSLFRPSAKPAPRAEPQESSRTTGQFELPADLRQVASITNAHTVIGLGSVTPGVESERVLGDWIWHRPHIELLHVMSGLIDASRDGLVGHSGAVARLVRGVCERLELPRDAVISAVMAALLHDLGKPPPAHLTALAVAQHERHRQLAQQYVSAPRELFAAAELPEMTLRAIGSMYERFEGGGFPDGLSGEAIPVEARILAVADSYADLVSNPNNDYQRLLSNEEALVVLSNQAPAVFDPDVVLVLQVATGGEGLLHELLEQRRAVLVIDPEPEATVMLQLKLAEYDFEAQVVRTVEAAGRALAARRFAAVLCEFDIEEQADGLALLEGLGDRDADSVWLFLSRRHARGEVRKAFALGADDVVAKPVDSELLCSKVEQLVERRATGRPSSGVAGALGQLSLPDLVQVLWHSRRTCALRLFFGTGSGTIHIVEGRVVDAECDDLRGEEAFYALVMRGDAGRFEVDPHAARPTEEAITADPEHLLLQAMQRLDERD